MTTEQLRLFMSLPALVKNKYVKSATGCWLWTGKTDKCGYGLVGRYKPREDGSQGYTQWYLAHRIVWTQVNGEIPKGVLIRHSCDIPSCGFPDHLLAGTQLDNMKDRNDRGRQAKGEHNGRSKLTAAEVLVIRKLINNGSVLRQIARIFEVEPTSIRDIKKRKNWAHI